MDLLIRWPHPGGVQREALEIKVWRDHKPDPLAAGLKQLDGYLAGLGLDHGVLVIFDRRAEAASLAERYGHDELEDGGRRFVVLRL